MRRTLALLWTVGLFASTLTPGEYVPEVPILSFDKVVHVSLFFGFAMLWLSLYPTRRRDVFLGGVAVGIAIELLQHYLPIHRSGDVWDAVADTVGLLLALGVTTLARRRATVRESAA